MKTMKRLLALILVLVQVLSFPVEVAAAELFESAEETVSQTMSDTAATSESEPYLTVGWLDNQGDGWYEPENNEAFNGFDLFPGMEHNHIYYVNYVDDNGEWTREPVQVTASENINLVPILDLEGETIREGEEHGDCFYRISTDVWDQESYLYCQWNGWDLSFGISTSLNLGQFFTKPEYTHEAFMLGDFVMDPYAQENAFYLGVHEDWTVVEISQYDEEGNPLGGADWTTLTDLGGNMYKITVNDDIVYECCLHQDHFEVHLRVVMENSEGCREYRDYYMWCRPGAQPPYLTFCQLENWDEGWFENPDFEDHQGYDLFPGDDHRHIYYVRYQDENGDWQRQPVHITASDNVTLTKIQDMEGETIREGEANAEYFYSVTTDSWDQETWVACQWNGWDLRFGINNSLIDGNFFSVPEYSNEAFMRHSYVMDPQAEENAFYFGFKSDYWTVVEVSQRDQDGNAMSGADLVTLSRLDNGMYKITLNEGVAYDYCSRQESFGVDLCVTLEDPDGNPEYWYGGAGCEPGYMPYLSFVWLDNWGEGWFQHPEAEYYRGYDLLPGNVERQVYFVNYMDENGEWQRQPVHVSASDNVTLTKLQDVEDEVIVEGEANADYFYQITTDVWDQACYVSCQWEGWDLKLWANNSLTEGHYFCAPEYSTDAYIAGDYVMDPQAEENSFYFIYKNDHWTMVDASFVDWDGNVLKGADKATVTMLGDNIAKITLNEGVAYDFCSRREGFWIDLVVTMEDPDGNREQWYTGKGCTPGYMPYLSFGWLENWGEGWFEYWDSGWDTGYNILPGDEYFHIYYVNYLDENGEWVREPVNVNATDNLTLERLADPDEYIKEGEQNADCFYRVQAQQWDVESMITCQWEGWDLQMHVNSCRDDFGFYSEPNMSNETYLRDIPRNGVEDTVVYFGTHLEGYEIYGISQIDAPFGVSFAPVGNGMYRITIPAGHFDDFHLNINPVVKNPDGYVDYDRWCGVHTYFRRDDAMAVLSVDDADYYIFENCGKMAAWNMVFDENREINYEECYWTMEDSFPAGVRFDLESGTFYLENADISRLSVGRHEEIYRLPYDAITIVLTGENRIVCDYEGAMWFRGVDVTFTGDGSLYVETKIHDGMNESAISLHDYATMTVSGSADITAVVSGESYDEEGNLHHVNVLGGAYMHELESGVGELTIEENGSLTTVLPEKVQNFASLGCFRKLTVTGGSLNVQHIDLDAPDASYVQTGGTVTITVRGHNVHDEDGNVSGMHYNGLSINRDGTMDISGGKLTVDMSGATGYTDWGTGIEARGTDITISGGELALIMGTRGRGIQLGGYADEWVPNPDGRLTVTGGKITATAPDMDSYDYDCTAIFTDVMGTFRVEGGTVAVRNAGIWTCGTFILDGGVVTADRSTVSDSGVKDVWGAVFGSDAGSAVYIYDGLLRVNVHNAYSAMTVCGTYIQSGGAVRVYGHYDDEWYNFSYEDGNAPSVTMFVDGCGWDMTMTGGIMIVDAPCGVNVYRDDYNTNGRMRMMGGTIDITSQWNGMRCNCPVEITGGTINIRSQEGNGLVLNPTYLLENSSVFTVSGGQINIDAGNYGFVDNRSTFNMNGGRMDLNSQLCGVLVVEAYANFNGGVIHAEGPYAFIGEFAQPMDDYSEWITMADDIHFVSDKTGKKLEFLTYYASFEFEDGSVYDYVQLHLEEDNTPGDFVTEEGMDTATSITISAEAGQVEEPVSYSAYLEMLKGKITLGTPVTVRMVVNTTGTVSLTLPEGVELVPGSLSVNGTAAESLENIAVNGSAVITFRIKALEEGSKTITAVTTCRGEIYTETVTFNVSGFDISAPSTTRVPRISVNGYGTPDDTIRLVETTKGTEFTGTVSALGTFVMPIELPVADEEKAEDFVFDVYVGNKAVTQLAIRYDPEGFGIDRFKFTNRVHNQKGEAVDMEMNVDWSTGEPVADHAYYTYWPEEPVFDFEVEPIVPDGFTITDMYILVGFVDLNNVPDPDEEDYEEVPMFDLDGDNIWEGSGHFDKAPYSFQIITTGTDENGNVLTNSSTRIIFIPIMDPSGNVYFETKDNPVAGATVKLYFGGNGTQPGEPELFDMTNFGQVNPQKTDALGHYAWDVPDGWWMVVAEDDDGHTAQSDWLRVLPVQEGVNLFLNHSYKWIIDREATDTQPGEKHEQCTVCGGTRNEGTVIPALVQYTVTYTTASISLAGDIGVNYYVQLSENIVTDPEARMQFTVAGQTQVVPLQDAEVSTDKNGVTTYRFTCKVAAKQMTEAITGQMYISKGAVGDPKVYSVKAYCDAAIPVYGQYAAYADLVALMEAMLNYGGYSQVQFGYNTGSLANADLADTSLPVLTEDDVAAYAHGATGSEAGINVASVSLLLESTTTIRFYFKLDGTRSIDEYTFLVDGVETVPVASGENMYYVDKVNVAAKDLDVMASVTVGGLTARYCGLSYVRQVAVLYPSYYKEALVNVAKALYAYNQAANTYFD